MRKRNDRRRILFAVIAVILAVLMIGSLAVAMVRADEDTEVSEETATLEAVKVSPNDKLMEKNAVYIDNIDVSGMTQKQAEEAVQERMEKLQKDVIVLNAGPKSVRTTAGELGLDYRNKEIVEEALSIGKKGNILKRFLAEKEVAEDGPIMLSLDLEVDEDQVKKVISTKKSAINCDPTPNGLRMNDNGTFSILGAEDGVTLAEDESVKTLVDYMDQQWHGGQGGVELNARLTPSADTSDQLRGVRNIIGTATTEYDIEDTARETNITLAAMNINGSVLYPGDEFSTVKAIGPTTQENGFALGASYASNDIVETYGGGVCQVSSTLYDAVLEAELQVTERHNHTMRIHYVRPAFDATISEDTVDFRFVNNTDTPIYIEAQVGYGTLTFNIYGRETRSSARTIEFESVQKNETDFTTVFKADDNLAFGDVREYYGEKGVEAELWKKIYVDGVLESEELVNSSTYRPTNHMYRVGTGGASEETRAALINACERKSMDAVYTAIKTGTTA